MDWLERQNLLNAYPIFKEYCTGQVGQAGKRPTQELIEAMVLSGSLDTPMLRVSPTNNARVIGELCLLDYCIECGYFEEALVALKNGATVTNLGSYSPVYGGACLPIVRFIRSLGYYNSYWDQVKDYGRVEFFLRKALQLGLTTNEKNEHSLIELMGYHFCGTTNAASQRHYKNIMELLLKAGQMIDPQEGYRVIKKFIFEKGISKERLEVAKMLIHYGADVSVMDTGGKSAEKNDPVNGLEESVMNLSEKTNYFAAWVSVFGEVKAKREAAELTELINNSQNKRLKEVQKV